MLKLVLEASIWKVDPSKDGALSEPGEQHQRTGCTQFGYVTSKSPKQMVIRAARGRANHLIHQGSIH
jgi:hypothetical protein